MHPYYRAALLPLIIWTLPLLSAIGELQSCYRLPVAEILWGVSWLNLIFIRIACLHCHILSLPCTLYWTQFSAVVAPILTAWFFTPQQSHTGWPVISAFTITGPPVVDLLKEGFSSFPRGSLGDMLCCGCWDKPPTELQELLASCHKSNSVLHRPRMCRSYTSTRTLTVDRHLKAETVQAHVTAPQRVAKIDER